MSIFDASPFGALFGGKKKDEPQLPPPPDYVTDPNYKAEQDFLQPYGFNLLNGNIPDYYKSIGEPNSQQFQDYLGLTNRDTAQGAAEAAARTGRGRGGSLASVTAQAIGDNSAKLRYADFLQSQEGKKFLMGEGKSISEGVRTAGQTEGANTNNFNLKAYDYTRQNALYDIQRQDAASAQEGELMGHLFNGAVGAVGGFATGGPVGAAIGGLQGFTGADIGSLFSAGKTAGGMFGSSGDAAKAAGGVSSVGAISGTSDDELMRILKSLHSNN